MKRLDKDQSARHLELAAKLSDAREELNAAITEFNDEVNGLFDKTIKPKLEALNEAIGETNDFRIEVHSDMEAYQGEKSERWQESNAGVEYQEWMDQWEGEIDEVNIDEPEDIDEPDVEVDKKPRDREQLELPADRKIVFANNKEFLDHHAATPERKLRDAQKKRGT
jgi:hypothetical protein